MVQLLDPPSVISSFGICVGWVRVAFGFEWRTNALNGTGQIRTRLFEIAHRVRSLLAIASALCPLLAARRRIHCV